MKQTKNPGAYDLTTGDILPKLIRLSLPTIGSQLVQMAYNFADMFWLGRLSSGAVAASGTVGVFLWLSLTLQHFGSKGAEIGVSQNLGRGDIGEARGFLQSSLFVSLCLGLLCGALFFVFRGWLVGLFAIREAEVERNAINYLMITALGLPFTYINAAAVSAFNGSGNSATPFYINLACLCLNAVLDPLFIFTAGLGVVGAAIATSLSQAISMCVMLIALKRYRHSALQNLRLWRLPRAAHLKRLLRWGAPPAFETFCFCFFIIIVSRLVASFGSGAMAVQRLGNQVDQFSYLISSGFAAALSAYIGQNYGAERHDRIVKGFAHSTLIMGVWGVLATLNLLFFSRFYFRLFVPGEPLVVQMGSEYLRIFAICQLAASLEGVGESVFRGFGKMLSPALVSIVTNVTRVVLAWTLSRGALAQNGIWWALAISSFMRGAGMYLFGYISMRKETARNVAGKYKLV
jgi:putative MATE family efflux protein